MQWDAFMDEAYSSPYLLGTMHDYCFVCALEDHVSLVLKNTKDTITPRQFIGKLKSKS